jgi:uncharacterized SAM-binding protein YcdF (DUF218 family)
MGRAAQPGPGATHGIGSSGFRNRKADRYETVIKGRRMVTTLTDHHALIFTGTNQRFRDDTDVYALDREFDCECLAGRRCPPAGHVQPLILQDNVSPLDEGRIHKVYLPGIFIRSAARMSIDALLIAASDIAHAVILPPGSLFLLMAIGLLVRRRLPVVGRVVTGGAILALYVVCTDLGAQLFVAPLERLTVPLRAVDRTGAQAIVVLGAGRMRDAPEYAGRDIPDYIALARLRYAAHLQRATGLPILVSGGSAQKAGVPSLADSMAAALREDFGVPVRWVEGRSQNTAENASFSAAMLAPEKIRRILLVTDAMHMPRARTAFQHAEFDVVAAPTMFFTNTTLSLTSLMPSAEALRESWYAIYELVGIGWYWVRYS